MTTRRKERGGTAAQNTAANEVLYAKEICVETDTGRFKIGDGVTTWTALPYADGVNGIPTTQKGAANGVATLGADSKIPGAQLPALAISETFTVASQAAMLALTAQRGDVALRTDLTPSPAWFMLTSDSPGTLADWVRITAAGGVTSVDGATGAVSLSATYVDVAGDTMTGPLVLPGNAASALQATPLQQVQSLIAATPRKLSAVTVMGIGDSLTAQGQDVSILGGTFQSSRSFLFWAQMLSGGKLRHTGSSGLGGKTASEVRTNCMGGITGATVKPEYCSVLAGVNDLLLSGIAGLAGAYTGITGICSDLLSAGITPVLCTIPGYRAGAANLSLVTKLNSFIRRHARELGVPLADFFEVCADPALPAQTTSTTQGTWKAGYLTQAAADSVHPSSLAHLKMGEHLSAVLNVHTAQGIELPVYNDDTVNKLANGLMVTDATADGIPDGWNADVAGTLVTHSIVADAAIPGNWWRINKTGTDNTQYSQALLSGLVSGNTVKLSGRLKINALSAAAATLDIFMYDFSNSTMLRPNVVPRSAAQIAVSQQTTLQSAIRLSVGGPDGGPVVGEGLFEFEGVIPATAANVKVGISINGGAADVQFAQLQLHQFTPAGLPV